MEFGHNTTYDLELIAWRDNDPGSRHLLVRLVSVQLIQNILHSLISCQPVIRLFVRHPLFDDQFIGCGIRIRSQRDTHIIEAFKRTDRSRADRNNLTEVILDPFDRTPTHRNKFGMHLMPFDRLAFHGFERPGSDMERQFFPSDSQSIDSSQNFRCKMQTRCRGGHRTFYLGVNRLVGLQIAFLSFAIQIRRNRQYARCI